MGTLQIQAAQRLIEATLASGPIAEAVERALPFASTAQRWGDEIYFDVPVKLANAKPTRDVKVGDLAYWPEGPSLCIFFGKTPASKGEEPRPASDVTVIGRTAAPADLLRSIQDGTPLTLSRTD